MSMFNSVAATLGYYKMYDLIMRDFMGRDDCRTCHAAGNIMFNGANAAGPVSGPCLNMAIQGGSDNIAQGKKVAYEAALKAGAALDEITGTA